MGIACDSAMVSPDFLPVKKSDGTIVLLHALLLK
jgi:hypothetical protein